MENNNIIFDELKQLCPALTGVGNNVPYTVSPNYFKNLPDLLIDKVSIAADFTDVDLTRNVYTTPIGYFESLSSAVTTRVGVESSKNEVFQEMETLFPLLNTINKQPVYSLPTNYFNTLAHPKLINIVEDTGISYFGISRKLFNYAAAAAVTGILAVGIFFFTGKPSRDTSIVNSTTRASYNIKTLSEQEIVNFLKTTSPQENVVTNNANKSRSENSDIKKLISEMSDKEIKQFLMENGGHVDM